MLTRLQIERLRGIADLVLEDAGRVNLVVGRNDTGKTTFLEAIRLLLSGDPRHLRRPNRSLIDRYNRPPETVFKLAFYSGSADVGLKVSGQVDDLSLVATARIQELEDEQDISLDLQESEENDSESLLERGEEVVVKVQVNDGPTATITVPLVSTLPQPPSRRSFSDGTLPKIPPATWLGTNRSEVWSNARRYSALVREENTGALIQVLQLIEPSLADLIVLSERSEEPAVRSYAVLEAKLTDQSPLPLESMGDGFASIISIVTATAAAGHSICLIDEIENGIHYSVLSSLWSAVHQTSVNYDSQVWATTHSLDCVAAAHEAFLHAPEALRVHRFDRTEGGHIKVHTFDHSMLGRALERGLDVR